MRHNKDDKRFSRNTGHLRSMMSNLTRDLLTHERIKTTTPKSKELRRSVEKMITLGKLGTLSARRRAMAFLHDKALVTKLFTELGPRYKDRKGGYTRSIKAGVRHGDCAPVSFIELVDGVIGKGVAKPEKETKAGAPKKKAVPKKEKAKEAAKADAKKKATPKKAAPKKEKAKETAKAAPKKKAATTKEVKGKAATAKKETTKGKGKDK